MPSRELSKNSHPSDTAQFHSPLLSQTTCVKKWQICGRRLSGSHYFLKVRADTGHNISAIQKSLCGIMLDSYQVAFTELPVPGSVLLAVYNPIMTLYKYEIKCLTLKKIYFDRYNLLVEWSVEFACCPHRSHSSKTCILRLFRDCKLPLGEYESEWFVRVCVTCPAFREGVHTAKLQSG